MRVLITNDDGIGAQSLEAVVEWAKRREDISEIEIAAPKYEQSGMSHAIELHKAFEVLRIEREDGIAAYSVDSSPADCVRFAILGLKREYDLVISGINNGFNVGSDILYSGTVSAALEAAALGARAIALSTEPQGYGEAMAQMDGVMDYIKERGLFELHSVYNINIPREMAAKIRITRQGGPFYSDDFPPTAENGDLYMPTGKCVYEYRADPTLDTDTVLTDKCISIMPLSFDRTEREIYRKLTDK